MKIGILGTGIIGRTHASKLSSLGHEVMVGTRDPDKTLAHMLPDEMGNEPFRDWQAKHPAVQLGTFGDAAHFGELIVNALNGQSVMNVFGALDKDSLKGKVVMDITNALDFSKGMPPSLFVMNTDSLGEQLQRLLSHSHVVKTLNTVTAVLQTNPGQLADGQHVVFMSGNDAEAKEQVRLVLESYGWQQIIDLGDITTARGTEAMMLMWLRLWTALGTPLFNYQIVK